jgi:hypothetical protein
MNGQVRLAARYYRKMCVAPEALDLLGNNGNPHLRAQAHIGYICNGLREAL